TVTAAEAAATTTETITAAEAATIATKAAAITTAVETVVAETVALILAAPAAATSVKTHALLVTFASPQDTLDKHVGRMTCRIHRKVAVWDSLYQLFVATRMIFTKAIPFRSICRGRCGKGTVRRLNKAFRP
ncbi:MAG: hypothetical protein WBL20_06530, partial [Sphingobium sp.]